MKAKVLVAVVTLSMVFGISSYGWGAGDADLDRKINQTNQKINKLRKQETKVLVGLVQTQEEMDVINSDLNKLNSRRGKTQKKMQAINSQLGQTQSAIDQIKSEIDGFQGTVNQRLVGLYKYGYQSYLEALFQVKNFSEFISRFEMVGNYVHKDLQMIKTLQMQHDKIANKQQQISEYQQDLEREKRVYDRLQNRAQKIHTSLKIQVRKQKQQLDNIVSNREALEQALNEMEEMSRSMESEIRDVQNNSTVALGSGAFCWPTIPRGRITSYFGYRVHPILKKARYHSGYDIALAKGTPVVATDNGRVIFSGNKGGYGKTVMLDHGAGFSSVYGHNSVLLVSNGQEVTKGQQIALVGSTGLSTGPHLHFEIRKNGVPQNPGSYL